MPDASPTSSTTPGPVARIRAGWKGASLGQRLVAAGATAGTVIGLLAIVVPAIFVATTRPTTTGTVQVQGADGGASSGGIEAVQGGLGPQALGASVVHTDLGGFEQYAVPVDAPWDELWAGQDTSNGDCYTAAQLDWLHRYGTVIPENTLTTEITNTADSGSELTVSEIRPQGTLTPPPGDTVTVGYYLCIGGGDDGIYAHILLGVDPVAVFDGCYVQVDSCYFSSGTPPNPGDPVVFAIRPGETRLVHLTYEQQVDFVGRFVATVSVDGQESTIDLSPGGVDIIAPAVTRPLAHLTIGGGPMFTYCTDNIEDATPSIEGCTLEQWLAILAAG